MEKPKKMVDDDIEFEGVDQVILDILEDLDNQENEQKKVKITEEEKAKRKSIWDRLSH